MSRRVHLFTSLLVSIWIVTFANELTRQDINDNYCDLADGSDELATSACSHLKVTFTCNANGYNSHTIPTSRINDGVCDCCDGSDEANNSPFKPNCPNTCDNDLVQLKKTALSWHRTVQAALHTKADQVAELKRQKVKENKSYEALLSEKKELETMMVTMNFLLSKENKREREMRWKLLRERENHCAGGHDEACEYFSGEYFYDDEIVTEGFPLELLPAGKKLLHEYSPREQEYIRKLGTVERVRWSLCPVKTLLPDDDGRLYSKIGEYLTYMATPGAKISQDRTAAVMRKHTLLGPFLEFGSKGHVLAGIVASELLGLLLSPVTAVGSGAVQVVRQASALVWSEVHQRSSYRGLVTPSFKDVASVEVTTAVAAASVVEKLFNFLVEATIPGSAVANVLSYLDYNRYPWMRDTVDWLALALDIPIWMFEIAIRSPGMYYDHFVNGKSASLPPRRQCCMLRHALDNAGKEIALLQEQITAEEELRELLVAAKEGGGSSSSNSNDPAKRKKKKGGGGGGKTATGAPRKRVKMDYGPDGSFEVLKDVCLERSVGEYDYRFCFFGEVTQGSHTSMGHFSNWGGSKSAAASSLGGLDLGGLVSNPEEALSALASQLYEVMADPSTNVPQYLQSTGEWISTQTSTLLSSAQSALLSISGNATLASFGGGGGGLSSNNSRVLDELERMYSRQWYDEGTVCQTKTDRLRSTVVELVCDVNNEIVDVVELEMCTYKMVVSTPMLCTKRTEERSLAELDRLGVFGFSSKK